jgi:hypothetical protein
MSWIRFSLFRELWLPLKTAGKVVGRTSLRGDRRVYLYFWKIHFLLHSTWKGRESDFISARPEKTTLV